MHAITGRRQLTVHGALKPAAGRWGSLAMETYARTRARIYSPVLTGRREGELMDRSINEDGGEEQLN
jgi:hypothetical protein